MAKPAIPQPPQWKSECILTRKLRFAATSQVTDVSLTVKELAQSIGIFAVTVSSAYIIPFAFRVKSVEMWGYPTSGAGHAETIIDWNSNPASGAGYSPGLSVEGISSNVSEPAYVKSSPPPNSYASWWHNVDDTNTLFKLTCPDGTILDIVFEYVVNDAELGIAAPSVSSATVGAIYHRQPDALFVIQGGLNTIA